jgi:CDP-glucose 4,6-dehydratase
MIQQLENTYKGKKVFVTGHTGFKGSWLLKTLHMLGAEIKGYALAPQTPHDLFNYIEGDRIADSVIGDLRDRQKLMQEITSFQPDFIFHLAAQPLVRLSYEIPSETFEVNAIGTAYVFDAVRLLPGRCQVVIITTDKVYHNNEWSYPYRESDRLGGYDPYSASKACSELIINSYRNSFFNLYHYQQHQKAIAVARAGNVIGGGDWAKDRLVPDIIRALAANKEVFIRNPYSLRPWQHVLEPIVGYLLLGSKLESNPLAFSQAYNFGPNAEDSLHVEDLVKCVLKNWQGGSYRVQTHSHQPHEAGLLKLDISKVVTELGWKPRWDADAAISHTVNWYKTFLTNKDNIGLFTEGQIQSFLTA